MKTKTRKSCWVSAIFVFISGASLFLQVAAALNLRLGLLGLHANINLNVPTLDLGVPTVDLTARSEAAEPTAVASSWSSSSSSSSSPSSSSKSASASSSSRRWVARPRLDLNDANKPANLDATAAAATGDLVLVNLADTDTDTTDRVTDDAGPFASLPLLGAGLAGLSSERAVIFQLFTREAPTSPSRLRVGDTLRTLPFRPGRPTKILIHGYTANSKPGSGISYLKDVLLRVADVNVILVDWSGVDSRIYPLDVQSSVPRVGAEVAHLVKTLVEAGTRLEDVHIIGHSLGAHIAGAAGSQVLGPAAAGRVTGLDPAGPLFEGRKRASRLDPSDAGFVDVVHTDGGYLGTVQPVGHVDFYVNGGMHRQPSCGADLYGLCSHCFAFEVYAYALEHPKAVVGTQCDSQASLRTGKCSGNERTALGLRTNRRSRGSFYVSPGLKPSANLRNAGLSVLSSTFDQVSKILVGDGVTVERFSRC